jgi:small subunit ribosomal protein S17
MTEKVRRTKVGTVVSDKMDKTIVVQVDTLKRHSKYHKSYKVSTKFKAHDQNNEFHVGDKVEIEETKPISKHKHFKVVKKLN